MTLRLATACDHAGLALKAELIRRLEGDGYRVTDLGTHVPDSVDYPDFAAAAAQAILRGEAERAVLICGSGVGMAMAANAVPGIRAVVGTDPYLAKMARRHNDANVLTLGARMTGPDLAYEVTKAFLQEPFEGGRHQRRVEKIEALKQGR